MANTKTAEAPAKRKPVGQNISETRRTARIRRHARLRKKVAGTAEAPRLMVNRSARHIHVQLIDDSQGVTIAAASSIEADFAFHRAIAAASGNRYLRASLEQLGARSIVVPHARVASASNDGVDAAAALAEHRAIVDAIRSGDALGASAAMRAHLAASASRRRA